MELARRAAKTFAADSAETQPLSSPLSSTLAAVLSKPGDAAPGEDDSQPTLGPVKRSLQKDFVEESFGGQHGLPDELELPDNQLGEYPDPMESVMPSLDEQKAPEQADVASIFDCPDAEQVPQQLVVTSVFDDADPEQLPFEPRGDEVDVAALPAVTGAGSQHQTSEEESAMAGPPDSFAKGMEDEPSASDPMDAAEGGPGVEEMLDAEEGLNEEPPVVSRRSQWELKPAPKRRGRRPATPQAAAPKPAAAPKARGGSKRTAHYITIDDIVPPTSAAWKADPAPSKKEAAGKPVKPKANDGKRKAAKRKAASKKKIQPPSVETDAAEVDDFAKPEEDEKNKIVWLPVSRESATMVALIFNPKLAPVQDQSACNDAGEDHVSLVGPAAEHADKGEESVAEPEPEVKKAKTNGPSFGRRTCPKTSPASERWKAVRHVYLKCIMDHAIAMGCGGHSYEVRVKIFFCPNPIR